MDSNTTYSIIAKELATVVSKGNITSLLASESNKKTGLVKTFENYIVYGTRQTGHNHIKNFTLEFRNTSVGQNAYNIRFTGNIYYVSKVGQINVTQQPGVDEFKYFDTKTTGLYVISFNIFYEKNDNTRNVLSAYNKALEISGIVNDILTNGVQPAKVATVTPHSPVVFNPMVASFPLLNKSIPSRPSTPASPSGCYLKAASQVTNPVIVEEPLTQVKQDEMNVAKLQDKIDASKAELSSIPQQIAALQARMNLLEKQLPIAEAHLAEMIEIIEEQQAVSELQAKLNARRFGSKSKVWSEED